MRGKKYAYVNSSYLQNKLAAMSIAYVHFKELAPNQDIRQLQQAADKKGNMKKSEREVLSRDFILAYEQISFLSNTIRPIQGSVENLFDGYLQFAEAGSAFIAKATGVPQYSTGFWQPDQPLCMSIMRGKIRFRYESASLAVTIPYVGLAPHMPHVIPAGSLIRVSLARWWRPADSQEMQEERCYLQLSGWFPKDST